MRCLRRCIYVVFFAAAAPVVLACGYCDEDRMAATYDHAVVRRAMTLQHEVAFLALNGTESASDATVRGISLLIGRLPGVDRDSIRISAASLAVSFAHDPVKGPLGSILESANRQLAGRGLSLALLRVMG